MRDRENKVVGLIRPSRKMEHRFLTKSEIFTMYPLHVRHAFCKTILLTVKLIILSSVTCSLYAQTQLSEEPWGTLADGQAMTRYTLTNATGARASFLPLGAAILSLEAPDRDGTLADVVLGFDSAADYNTGNGPQFGLTIGRFAGRIFGTELQLDGETFHLQSPPNRDGSPGQVVLHGGPDGFGARVWQAAAVETTEGTAIRFNLDSPDGDQGFPGHLTVSVTYTWTSDFRLIVDYQATTNKTTVVNFTQHSYFNLAGAGDILQHTLMINADHYTFALPDNRPTGEIRSVLGTAFDFTQPKPIGRDIDADDPQMLANRGYNQNFVLRRSTMPGAMALAAVLHDPASGRTLTVSTNEPGLFLYTANFLDTSRLMKGGVTYPQRAGVALETGKFPDAPNLPHFPRTTLIPGETFSSRTEFAFSAL
jgi:aldose 1-epimerase